MTSAFDRLTALQNYQRSTAATFAQRALKLQGDLRAVLAVELGCDPERLGFSEYEVNDKEKERQASSHALLTENGLTFTLVVTFGHQGVNVVACVMPSGKGLVVKTATGTSPVNNAEELQAWARKEVAGLETYLTVDGIDAILTAKIDGGASK